MKTPRTLRADEIDCRTQNIIKSNGVYYINLLLYKDARCDMEILDETFGIGNWQRDHKEVNGDTYCGIGIWDEEKSQWVWKWDAGEESMQSAVKGRASDAEKRASVNWGIGRELYTAKGIFFKLDEKEITIVPPNPPKNKYETYKLKNKVKFNVSLIEYTENREIKKVIISDQDKKERLNKVY